MWTPKEIVEEWRSQLESFDNTYDWEMVHKWLPDIPEWLLSLYLTEVRLAAVRELVRGMPHGTGCECRLMCQNEEDIECGWSSKSYCDSCSTHNEIVCTCDRGKILAVLGEG